jgi:hypothetical protein
MTFAICDFPFFNCLAPLFLRTGDPKEEKKKRERREKREERRDHSAFPTHSYDTQTCSGQISPQRMLRFPISVPMISFPGCQTAVLISSAAT